MQAILSDIAAYQKEKDKVSGKKFYGSAKNTPKH